MVTPTAAARARTLWLIALLDVVFLPIILYSFLGGREQTSIVDQLLSITGTQAAGLLLYVLALGTRMRSKGSPFGVPLHRWVGLGFVGTVILHIILALTSNPDNYQLLVFWDAPPRGAAATASLICWLCVLGLGEFRKLTSLPPKTWRPLHSAFAWLGSIFALAHVLWIDQLVNSGVWLLLFAGMVVTAFYLWVTRAKGVSKSTSGPIPKIVGWVLVLGAILTITATVATWMNPNTFTIGYTQNELGPVGPADRDMLYKVRQAGLWEMPVGVEVMSRGSSPELRDIGRKISEEHHELDKIVTDAASQLGVPLPSEPTPDQQKWIAKIHDAPNGAVFDHDSVFYLRMAHGKVLPLLAQIRTGTRNELIRQTATQSIEFVTRHIGYLESTGLVNFAELPESPNPSPYQQPVEASYFDTHEARSLIITSIIVAALSILFALIVMSMLRKPKTATRAFNGKSENGNGNGNGNGNTLVVPSPVPRVKPKTTVKPGPRHRKKP